LPCFADDILPPFDDMEEDDLQAIILEQYGPPPGKPTSFGVSVCEDATW